MIRDWRTHWHQQAFPFYYVQIAPFAYGGDTGQAGELRDAQRLTLSTPDTGMAVTLDIGDPGNIHPRNKQEVGRRLALWALAKTYGHQDIVYSGPLYKEMTVENGRVRVSFEHADGGLVARGPLAHFEVAGADQKFVAATAELDGEAIVVWSDAVPQPAAVRYAWGATDQATLFNRAGLPASSFSSEAWYSTGK
jgi:sialate O-acetylesterase